MSDTAPKPPTLGFTPAEWALFEAVEILAAALIRRGTDPHLLAGAFLDRAKAAVADGGEPDAVFAKGMILHQLAASCATPSRWAAQPAPVADGGVVPFPVRDR